MADFMIRFLFANLFLSIFFGIFFTVKKIWNNQLTSQTRYHLWYVFLGSLVIPFLPVHPVFLKNQIFGLFSIFGAEKNPSGESLISSVSSSAAHASDWMNDFTVSVSRSAPSMLGNLLFLIWMTGILVMTGITIKSLLLFHLLKKSALPLQDTTVTCIYQQCLKETKIFGEIPVYSTAFLKSPIMTGFFHPAIYVPIALISEGTKTEIRYMLLHELYHYKHRDSFVNGLMNLGRILYWFHPFIWYAQKEMEQDRETFCDSSVLDILSGNEYQEYGLTLLRHAQKVSSPSYPFASGISTSMKQLKTRILTIASYEQPSARKKVKSRAVFCILLLLFSCFTPFLSAYAFDETYSWQNPSRHTVSYSDYSSCFDGFSGTFVFYDLKKDSWNIYNKEQAVKRVSPDSTYKIYAALFGLDEGIISPENSRMSWNGETYPFESWNQDQNLSSAMKNSVNWYFDAINEQLGKGSVSRYLHQIGYGNENLSGDFSSYWMESSLKISPVEQIELLTKLYHNDFECSEEHIKAVKEALLLSSSEQGTLYGKTGTGRINGKDQNGWFIGYIENNGSPCFFACRIEGEENATGSKASQIALSILTSLNLWE